MCGWCWVGFLGLWSDRECFERCRRRGFGEAFSYWGVVEIVGDVEEDLWEGAPGAEDEAA